MTDKQLRKLSRKDLLQILISQMEENEKLKKELDELKQEKENRAIVAEKAGSIAQAALQLNGVFEACEKAAQEYLESIKAMEKRMSSELIHETVQTDIEDESLRDINEEQ